MRNNDAFSNCHPAVNFVFFMGAIAFGVTLDHPAYLIAGVILGFVYYLLLHGRRGWRMILGLVPMFLALSLINPFFNQYGKTVLFTVLGRKYTTEALLYGMDIAAVFVVTMLWFGCYNAVMTSDKFTALFGNLIPALSLVLVMVLRMIPNLIRKAKQIIGARKSIGKGLGEQSGNREKLTDGVTVLSALTSWALEGSVVTGDSMRSRGYGAAKRTSFHMYTMKKLDWSILSLCTILAVFVIREMVTGGTQADFTPDFYIAPVRGIHVLGLLSYCAYLLIPTILHIKEAIQWHISRSKI